LTCPAGFETMLVEHFGDRFEFEIIRSRSRQIEENTQPDWSQIDPSEFREGQFEVLQKMVEADCGRVVVPPGVGKSFFIGRFAKVMHRARIVVCTDLTLVLEQLYDDLKKLLGDQVGIITGKHKKNIDARILCVSLGTLQKFVSESQQNFDVLILDEYHCCGSARRLATLETVRRAKLFGLSANGERNDKSEFRINGIFGPLIYEMSHAEAEAKKLVTPICVVWVPVVERSDCYRHEYLTGPEAERKYIWEHVERNRAIARAARMFSGDDQVLISVKNIFQALHIRRFLPEFTVVYGVQKEDTSNLGMYRAMGLMDGVPEMTSERLMTLRQKFAEGTLKKVIATKVFSHGLNFPGLSVVIRADGMNSMTADTQWPGRASRIQDGKTVSLVFDMTDQHVDGFLQKALQRRRRYQSYKWKQISMAELQKWMG
jgi:superfamily II DNA or RNA helicase